MKDIDPDNLADYGAVKNHLKVRLYSADYIESRGASNADYLCREALPGTISLLVLDLPDTIVLVKRADANAWNKKDDELFRSALERTWKSLQTETHNVEVQEGTIVKVISCGEPFTSSLVLDPRFLSKNSGKHGLSVSAPHPHIISLYAINDLKVLQAMSAQANITDGEYQNHQGRISPRLYWYHKEEIEEVEYSLGESFSLSPSEKFLSMLNQLR